MKIFLPYLAEVSHVEKVKWVKQFTVPQAKLVMAHLKKCPDVLETQKLQGEEKKKRNLSFEMCWCGHSLVNSVNFT